MSDKTPRRAPSKKRLIWIDVDSTERRAELRMPGAGAHALSAFKASAVVIAIDVDLLDRLGAVDVLENVASALKFYDLVTRWPAGKRDGGVTSLVRWRAERDRAARQSGRGKNR
jgi:hypothetical protein